VKDGYPIASWRVSRDGLIVWFGQHRAIIPFGRFGDLILEMLGEMMKREGRAGENKP